MERHLGIYLNDYEVIYHGDLDCQNNFLQNLELMTRGENMRHHFIYSQRVMPDRFCFRCGSKTTSFRKPDGIKQNLTVLYGCTYRQIKLTSIIINATIKRLKQYEKKNCSNHKTTITILITQSSVLLDGLLYEVWKQSEQARIPWIKIEMLMGHSLGITRSYARFTEDEMLEDYLLVIDHLTVSQNLIIFYLSLCMF